LPDALRQKLQRNEKTAAIVLEVEPESPAHKAGIVIGDILVSVSDHPVTHLEDVHAQLAVESIGKSLPVKFVRGGAIQEAMVVVGEREHRGQ
jgi:S1-C subfamily serine protease